MRMSRLIARFPFETTAISPPGPEQYGPMAGQMPGNCRRRSSGPRILHRKGLARGLLFRAGDQGRRRS